ncbi:polysaccharide deacetylase family protein [Dawidia soli]|uniref:Polysaccharide deacetylase family protein n=1 Tax=Dawidia soli TaxID=2782352 RepID=A0AAP2DA89_9BACT|nr:polysaccharide deacetylase family protein [Dawidia soli]MBT1688321.1 polysaccharide deacetylase family protein [Dawidia soli]
MKNGLFTISLDFELHWGGFEKWPLQQYRQYFMNTRKTIPSMLRAFQRYEVHVTWATVGMLMPASRRDAELLYPAAKPAYQQPTLSAYHYIRQSGIGEDESTDPFHFAASLVKEILRTPHQELGSHTFSHYYCNEAGQTVGQFRADLQAAQRAAALCNTRLTSLVFPRNQFNEDYLRVCYEEGFTAVRDNPRDWFWNIRSTQNESRWKRLNRGADAYIPLGKKNTYDLASVAVQPGLPLCLPASRLLRPYDPAEYFLNDMKISRICHEMERAARNSEVYHLWWHPHNFGNYPEQSMKALEKILQHFDYCRKLYHMSSATMGETADLIYQMHGKDQTA